MYLVQTLLCPDLMYSTKRGSVPTIPKADWRMIAEEHNFLGVVTDHSPKVELFISSFPPFINRVRRAKAQTLGGQYFQSLHFVDCKIQYKSYGKTSGLLVHSFHIKL